LFFCLLYILDLSYQRKKKSEAKKEKRAKRKAKRKENKIK
jgi:hypothetical protein